MGVPSRHILSQGPVLAALGRTLAGAVQQRMRASSSSAPSVIHTPGPELTAEHAPLPRALIDDYLRYVGADPRAYRGEVPPHLFPQWCFPVLARTLADLPYPLLSVVNGGCTVRVNAAIPDGEPLQVRARLFEIDDDGRRARLHQQVQTGTASAPDALAIDVFAVVPLTNGKNGSRSNRGTAPALRGGASFNGAPKPSANGSRPHTPEDAREVARFALGKDAGLSFAKLTGDFNPIHWVPLIARASGFRRPILHGFAELAYAWEGLNKNVLGGDVHAVRSIDVRLTRPLVLPHEVGLFVRRRELSLSDALGGPAYLTGSFRLRGEP
ncbi:MAG TPA: MaoC/PaaZ C-terminal domain-containing protein [Polyangiales bacterium]|nr:MaoC/PaaZ C-terminal domain-containing protein [Polyangiales bacterium]